MKLYWNIRDKDMDHAWDHREDNKDDKDEV
jgi:hypothetical protein